MTDTADEPPETEASGIDGDLAVDRIEIVPDETPSEG
jgi:hypothetical protein